MKQSIVKEAKMSEYNGKKSYTATFEDGITGYYDAKTIGELKQGDIVQYTAEEKTNKKGGKYNLLTVAWAKEPAPPLPQAEPQLTHYSNKIKYGAIDQAFILQERCRGIVESMKLTMQAVIEDKLTFDKVREQFKEVNTCVQEAIDEIISE